MKISTILIVSKTCKNRLADPNESNIFMSLEALLTVRGVKIMRGREPTSSLHQALLYRDIHWA